MAGIKEVKEKVKHKYFFPNVLASAMSKVDMRTQLEASMMSMSFIVMGMIISTVYIAIYLGVPLWYKIVLIVNLVAGMVFLSSFLVTTFQQYRSYLEAMEFQEEIKNNQSMKGGKNKDAEKNTK